MPYKSARHHWWPEGISRRWTNATGTFNVLFPSGEIKSGTPKAFGAIRNGHYVNFGNSPWSSSFESDFQRPDTAFPALLDWAESLTSKMGAEDCFEDRLCPQPITSDQSRQLGECLASLVVRSPNFRNFTLITAEYYQQRLGLKPASNEALISANIHRCFKAFSVALATVGKIAILFADESEFVFGDGFLHTFMPSPDMPTQIKCIVPLLPSVSVLCFRPTMMHFREPRLVTMRLRRDEIAFLNDLIGIYSKNFIFFRERRPPFSAAFAQRQHLTIRYHTNPWLDGLAQSIAQFRP